MESEIAGIIDFLCVTWCKTFAILSGLMNLIYHKGLQKTRKDSQRYQSLNHQFMRAASAAPTRLDCLTSVNSTNLNLSSFRY